MIHEADNALQELIFRGLSKEPDSGIKTADQITFLSPQSFESLASNSKPSVNLYLYDVRENLKLRDESFHVNRDLAVRETDTTGVELVAKKRGAIKMDLAYIVTAHSNGDASREHRLLAEVLMVLLREPYIASEMVPGSGGTALPLSVAQADHPACANPLGVWNALGGRMRPALFLVTTVPVDPYNTVWTRVVREAVLALRDGIDQENKGAVVLSRSTRVSVAGTVIDASSLKPIEGARVFHADPERHARTDVRGFFHMLDLPPGPVCVTISKPGYEEQTVEAISPPQGRPDQLDPFLARMLPVEGYDSASEYRSSGLGAEPKEVPKEGVKTKPSRTSR